MNNDSRLPVLIIGGGISGLALAHGLKQKNIPFKVFERDASSSLRAQGYRVRFGPEGTKAFSQLVSPAMFQKFEQTCAEMSNRPEFGRFDAVSGEFKPIPTANIPGRGPPGFGGEKLYTVDRTVLRLLLLDGLDSDQIQFGRSLDHYECSEDGNTVTAYFADGSSEMGTYLVGADGVGSKVKKQLIPECKFLDTGGRCIYGKTMYSEELLSKFPNDLLKGMVVIGDDNLILFMEGIRFITPISQVTEGRVRDEKDYVYWVLGSKEEFFEKNLEEGRTFSKLNQEEVVQLARKLTQHWNPSYKALFDLQDTTKTSNLRITSAKPQIMQWESNKLVTVMGDAIHPMAPTGGLGANTALVDAASLWEALVQTGGKGGKLTEEYEEKMRVRAGTSIELSFRGGKHLLNMKDPEDCKELDL